MNCQNLYGAKEWPVERIGEAISNVRVRFAAPNRLKLDIAPCPKCATALNRCAIDSRKVSHIRESGKQDIDRR